MSQVIAREEMGNDSTIGDLILGSGYALRSDLQPQKLREMDAHGEGNRSTQAHDSITIGKGTF